MTERVEVELKEIRLAVGSLIDILEELMVGIEQGLTPEHEWTTVVLDSLRHHRLQLGIR